MISDEKRREVAEKLRRQLKYMKRDDGYIKDVNEVEYGNLTYRNIAGSVEPSGNFIKGNYVHIVELLVDLIDRPISHNASGYDDVFECSECRCRVELIVEVCNEYGEPFHVPLMPSFCPNCGAEVVSND